LLQEYLMRKIVFGIALSIGLSGNAFAQVPCYSAAQCGAIRLQAEQQQATQRAAQVAAIADQARQEQAERQQAEARRREAVKEQARQAVAQQAAYDEQQRRQAQMQADAEVRAQEAAAIRAQQAIVQQAAYDEQQRRQARMQAEAEVRALQVAATQKAAYDEQQRQIKVESETRAAAQLAAEDSPDNHCHDQKTAGQVLDYFNGLQGAADFNTRAVDIDHLTTLKFDTAHSVMSCHGAFILQDGRRMTGTLSTRLNVAGNILTTFHID
jgi:DNA polymerase-3 subunit gamma/tau